MNIDDIDQGALETSVGLLDALIDAAAAALPGVTAASFARDLRLLGDGAAQAAVELETLGRPRRRSRHAA